MAIGLCVLLSTRQSFVSQQGGRNRVYSLARHHLRNMRSLKSQINTFSPDLDCAALGVESNVSRLDHEGLQTTILSNVQLRKPIHQVNRLHPLSNIHKVQQHEIGSFAS
jgi:hypothetical protein